MITNNCYLDHKCPYWFFMNVFNWDKDPTSGLIQVNHFNFLKIVKISASSNGNTETKTQIRESLGFWTLSIIQNSKRLENTTFRKLNLFPSSSYTQQGHNPNNYGKALMSAILQAITPNPQTNLPNVCVYIYIYIYIYTHTHRLQIKWGLTKKKWLAVCNYDHTRNRMQTPNTMSKIKF
jgi:hypothetical protein